MLIRLSDYYKLHGEPTVQALRDNAEITVHRANSVLELAVAEGFKLTNDQASGNPVASGFRPAGVNAATSNAANGSTHLTCEGIDVQDMLDGSRWLAVWCCRNLDVLERIGLWMEDPRWCAGRTGTDPWCHWQTRAPRSGRRIYVPYADVVAHPATDPDFYARNGLVAP